MRDRNPPDSDPRPGLEGASDEALVGQVDNLRALARGLVGDADADDLVQDAVVAGLTAAQRQPSRLAQWLAVVVRNRARRTGRDRVRRQRRERVAARPEAVGADVSESLARFELCRQLVDAVEVLPPATRQVVILRYFEDLPPRAIAARLGVPVNTVRTRLQRGLQTLRGRLDSEHGGDRGAWCALLVPFAFPGATAAAVAAAAGGTSAMTKAATMAAGASWMQANLKTVAVVALVLIGGVLAVLRPWQDDADLVPVGSTEQVLADGDRMRAGADGGREPASAVAEPDAGDAEPPQPDRTEVGSDLVTVPLRAVAVLGSTGEPAAGLEIAAELRAGIVYLTASAGSVRGQAVAQEVSRSDARGQVEWRVTPLGETTTATFRVLDPGWWCSDEAVLLTGRRQTGGVTTLRIVALDGVLRGTVHDESGAPVVGAKVTVGNRVRVETDEAGAFDARFERRRSRLQVTIRAPGFAHVMESIAINDLSEVEHSAAFVLKKGIRVYGFVHGPDGAPVAGARLSTFRSFMSGVLSGPDGSYELPWVIPGLEFDSVSVRHPGFRDASHRLTSVTEDTRVDFQLQAGIALTGQVVDVRGGPVADALVHWRPEALNNDEPNAVTDGEGRFSIEGGHDDWRQISVAAPGFAVEFADLPQSVDGRIDDVRVVLRAGRRIQARVTEPSGAPIVGSAVFVDRGLPDGSESGGDVGDSLGLLGRTDAEGYLELVDMPTVPLTMTFLADGFLREEIGVAAGSSDQVSVVLRPVAAISGRVLDAATGEPIPKFSVRLDLTGPKEGEARVSSIGAGWTHENGLEFVTEDGAWTTRGDEEFPPRGAVRVQISAEGYAPTPLTRVLAREESSPDDYVVRLERGAEVRGRVLDPVTRTGRAGAVVYLFAAGARPNGMYGHAPRGTVPRTETAADGSFAFDSVGRGDIRLLVRTGDTAPLLTEPQPVAGSLADVGDLLLSAGAVVVGRAVDPAGAPRAGAQIELHAVDPDHTDGIPFNARFDTKAAADGTYRFDRLMPGTYSVCLAVAQENGHRYPLQRQVVVGRAGTVTCDLLENGGAGRITGRLRGVETGESVSLLSLDPSNGLRRIAFLGVDGRYEFVGLPAGRYRLRGWADDAVREREVEITAGGAAHTVDLN